MRARLVALALAVSVVVTLAPPDTTRGQSGPIRIGMLAPLSGPFAGAGKDMVAGMQLSLEEIGQQVAGRRIELLIEDSEGNPQTALTKARKLVEQDRVHVLTGGLLAPVGYALRPFVDGARVPTTFPIIASDDLTQRNRSRWIVRTGATSSQPMHPFADWVIKNTTYRKIITLSLDHAFSWETIGGFHRVFEELGGQIVQKIWTPLNTNDYAPYIAQLRRDADAVVVALGGRFSIQFMKQYEAAGLRGRLPLLGNGVSVDETILNQMGDEAIGWITALHYSAALDNAQNQRFVRAFEAKAGKSASYFSEGTYTGCRWLVEAIKAVNGRVEDRDQFLAALRAVEIRDTVRGPLAVDAWGNPVQNVYIRKVERVGGKLQNTVIATVPAVSQFWKYNPDEYLKQPLYARDQPPCRAC
jgi:branched-chain amino acid transport system substrate-binding protein